MNLNSHKAAHRLVQVQYQLSPQGICLEIQSWPVDLAHYSELISQVAMLCLAALVGVVAIGLMLAALAAQALLAAMAVKAKAIQMVTTGKHLAAVVVERKITPQAAVAMVNAG
tara:strand:+ start:263 stop:601 length:339 start_codon:yes stop_codon:yes gene_type:complete